MTKEPRPSLKPSSQPSDLIWLVATLSLVLPWLAIAIGAVGFWKLFASDTSGWFLVALGLGLVVLDVAIDLWLAHPTTQASDEPHLNRRGHQHVGRVAQLCEPVEHGRGKAQLGDTVWIVEAEEDLATGSMVRVVDSDGAVLKVEPAGSEVD